MIKIGIDKFHAKNAPMDNCSDFRLDKNDGWNEFPCDTDFVLQWFVKDKEIYRYADTNEENYFLYPINFKCFANGFNLSIEDCWKFDKEGLKTDKTFLDSIPNHVLEKVRNSKAKILLNYGYEVYDELSRDTLLYLSSWISTVAWRT